MKYSKNAERFCRIQEHGQTVDLPLFEPEAKGIVPSAKITTEEMPQRVFNGSQSKAEAYDAIKGHLSASREKVMEALIDLGHATDRELATKLGWDVNRITARRKELQELGLVIFSGEKTGDFGIKNAIWTPDWKRIKELLRNAR